MAKKTTQTSALAKASVFLQFQTFLLADRAIFCNLSPAQGHYLVGVIELAKNELFEPDRVPR